MGNVWSSYTSFPSMFKTNVHPPSPHVSLLIGATVMLQKNVENVTSQNQWVAFALLWSARNKIGALNDESVEVPDSKMANGSCDLTESYSRSWNKGIQICCVRQKRSIKRNQTSGCYSWSPGRQRSRCLARYCWTIIYNSTPDRQLLVGFYRLC